MKVKKLSQNIDVAKYLKGLNVDSGGISILSKKAELYLIAIDDMHVGAANILKQDALSVGADLAVPRGTVIAKEPRVNTLLIGTKRHLEQLANKELAQPFGLKELAQKLLQITKISKPKKAKIMGIVNANDDSFYDKSRFLAVDAIEHIYTMIEDGADIIDIGAVSSRPNAPLVSVSQELERITPILDLIKEEKLYEHVKLSIDSYEPKVIQKALESGFCIVNDITGLADERVCKLVSEYQASAVIMHMQGTPQTMQNNPYYNDVLVEVYDFFQERIAKAESFGIKDIILDVGIGFGKRVEDNLRLIANLEHFLQLEKELLVGASRKSLINAIFPSSTEERLAGSLMLHLKAFENGASVLRVHDVYEHAQALRMQEAFFTL